MVHRAVNDLVQKRHLLYTKFIKKQKKVKNSSMKYAIRQDYFDSQVALYTRVASNLAFSISLTKSLIWSRCYDVKSVNKP